MRQPFLDALEREMNGYGKHTNQSEESRDVDVGKTLLLMFEERRDALLTRLSELRVKAIARGNGKILQMIEEVSEFAETIPDVSRLVFLEQGLDHLNFVIDFEENDGPLN